MITYTRAEKEGKPADYDCGLCPHSAPDVDGARAHQAVHVAGPELLAAIVISRGQWIHSTNRDQCLAAIAKAEPAPAGGPCSVCKTTSGIHDGKAHAIDEGLPEKP